MPTVEWNKRWGKSIEKFVPNQRREYYGMQWGDPSLSGWRYWLEKLCHGSAVPGDLSKVVSEYIKPYVTSSSTVLEIGAGGERWTKYLLEAKQIMLVDLNQEFFPYLKERYREHLAKLAFYQTTGYDLPNVKSGTIDYVFTFGTFVHIDSEGINAYLGEIQRVLTQGGVAVIHYSDKSKKKARSIHAFSDMNAEAMEQFAATHGLTLIDHNRTLLNHSNILVVQK